MSSVCSLGNLGFFLTWSFASPPTVLCNAICCLAPQKAKAAISFSRLRKLQRRMSVKDQANKAMRELLAV